MQNIHNYIANKQTPKTTSQAKQTYTKTNADTYYSTYNLPNAPTNIFQNVYVTPAEGGVWVTKLRPDNTIEYQNFYNNASDYLSRQKTYYPSGYLQDDKTLYKDGRPFTWTTYQDSPTPQSYAHDTYYGSDSGIESPYIRHANETQAQAAAKMYYYEMDKYGESKFDKPLYTNQSYSNTQDQYTNYSPLNYTPYFRPIEKNYSELNYSPYFNSTSIEYTPYTKNLQSYADFIANWEEAQAKRSQQMEEFFKGKAGDSYIEVLSREGAMMPGKTITEYPEKLAITGAKTASLPLYYMNPQTRPYLIQEAKKNLPVAYESLKESVNILNPKSTANLISFVAIPSFYGKSGQIASEALANKYKSQATFIKPQEVFSEEALKGQQLEKSTSPEQVQMMFEKTINNGKLEVAHTTSRKTPETIQPKPGRHEGKTDLLNSIKQGKLVKTPNGDIGLFVTPWGKSQPLFLRLSQETIKKYAPSLNIYSNFFNQLKQPTVAKIVVDQVKRLPTNLLNKGFKKTNAYITQQEPGTIVISARRELGHTTEPEAIIPTTTILKQTPNKFYTMYNGKVVRISEYIVDNKQAATIIDKSVAYITRQKLKSNERYLSSPFTEPIGYPAIIPYSYKQPYLEQPYSISNSDSSSTSNISSINSTPQQVLPYQPSYQPPNQPPYQPPNQPPYQPPYQPPNQPPYQPPYDNTQIIIPKQTKPSSKKQSKQYDNEQKQEINAYQIIYYTDEGEQEGPYYGSYDEALTEASKQIEENPSIQFRIQQLNVPKNIFLTKVPYRQRKPSLTKNIQGIQGKRQRNFNMMKMYNDLRG